MPKDTGRGATGETLAKAIKLAGGQDQLAARVGASPQAVKNWVRWGRVPFNRSKYVEAIANGDTGAVDLRSGGWRSSTAIAQPGPGPMFLTREEVEALTGKQRSDAQARELTEMGVKFLQRTDGSVVVLRALVEQLCGLTGDLWEARKREPRMHLRPQIRP